MSASTPPVSTSLPTVPPPPPPPAPPPPAQAVPQPGVSTIVDLVPPSTYILASEEKQAFDLLNAERSRCGFGKLAQNGSLDAAAKAHADYQLINNVYSHYENEQQYPKGFTGVEPIDRAIRQGYPAESDVSDAFVELSGTRAKAGYGTRAVRLLLGAPYHARTMLREHREIGMAVRFSGDVGLSGTRVIVQTNPAFKTSDGPQILSSADVKTYPCQGSTGVIEKLLNETPNPVPGRNLQASPLGSLIYVQTRVGETLTITQATMKQVSTGMPIILRLPVTSVNDPENRFKNHQGYVIADVPLAANESFAVTVQGSTNAIPFTRTFTFTTGGF